MGDADGLLCGWCWRGWGRGSWDAAPLSGSRGLSSGWARQSSLSKVSSAASEVCIGKGVWASGKGSWCRTGFRIQPKQTGKQEAVAETENSPFTYRCRNHGGWQNTRAAKSHFLVSIRPPQPLTLGQTEGGHPASSRGSASFPAWDFWRWPSARVKIALSRSRADRALELNQAIFGYQKHGRGAGGPSHRVLPVTCSEVVGRGEAGMSISRPCL